MNVNMKHVACHESRNCGTNGNEDRTAYYLVSVEIDMPGFASLRSLSFASAACRKYRAYSREAV